MTDTSQTGEKVDTSKQWIKDAVKEIQRRNRSRGHILRAMKTGQCADVMTTEEMEHIIAAHAPQAPQPKSYADKNGTYAESVQPVKECICSDGFGAFEEWWETQKFGGSRYRRAYHDVARMAWLAAASPQAQYDKGEKVDTCPKCHSPSKNVRNQVGKPEPDWDQFWPCRDPWHSEGEKVDTSKERAAMRELVEALGKAKVKYSRDHGMPNPSEAFPTHVEFSLSDWKVVADWMARAEQSTEVLEDDKAQQEIVNNLLQLVQEQREVIELLSAANTTTLDPCGVQDHADKVQIVGGGKKVARAEQSTELDAATLEDHIDSLNVQDERALAAKRGEGPTSWEDFKETMGAEQSTETPPKPQTEPTK